MLTNSSNMKYSLSFILVAILLLAISACEGPPARFTEKRMVIASKETVKLAEIGLSITNNGCGREWISEKGKPAYERAFCGLVVKYKDSTAQSRDGYPIYIKDIKVLIDKMNPWGVVEDSVPPGGCRVIITRLSDIYR
jgi:hypothetical protein